MNTRMFEEGQAMMAEAEAMAQQLSEMSTLGPNMDTEAFNELHAAYGAKFIEASAKIAEATYAEED